MALKLSINMWGRAANKSQIQNEPLLSCWAYIVKVCFIHSGFSLGAFGKVYTQHSQNDHDYLNSVVEYWIGGSSCQLGFSTSRLGLEISCS